MLSVINYIEARVYYMINHVEQIYNWILVNVQTSMSKQKLGIIAETVEVKKQL